MPNARASLLLKDNAVLEQNTARPQGPWRKALANPASPELTATDGD